MVSRTSMNRQSGSIGMSSPPGTYWNKVPKRRRTVKLAAGPSGGEFLSSSGSSYQKDLRLATNNGGQMSLSHQNHLLHVHEIAGLEAVEVEAAGQVAGVKGHGFDPGALDLI